MEENGYKIHQNGRNYLSNSEGWIKEHIYFYLHLISII